MGVFRSEGILHKKIRIPTDTCLEVMDTLGKMEKGSVEFIDLNKNDIEAKKTFSSMINRCEEIERKLNNFEKFAHDFHENIYQYNSFDNFLDDLEKDMSNRDRNMGIYFDIVESEIIEDEKKVIELVDSYTKIKENIEILKEKKFVYDKSFQLIATNPDLNQPYQNNQMMIEEGMQIGLNFIAGVAKADDELRMKKMIFRVSRGRAIASYFDMFDNEEGSVQKKIFTIFFQGGAEHILLHKLLQVCDLFGVSRYNIPRREEIRNQISDLHSEITQKRNFLIQAENSIRDYLRNQLGSQSQPGKIELYKLFFRKEKMIYFNLSKCLFRDNFIDGEVWILERDFENIKQVFRELDKHDKGMPTSFIDIEEEDNKKPTSIAVNEFLFSFQEIVNTYGVPSYREINPTYYNIVTFPFLFGMMFGDIGHGLILLIFGGYLCFFAEGIKQLKSSALYSIIKLRHLLLLMGFFATFCGFIYNDFLSVPLPLFGTCYENVHNPDSAHAVKKYADCVYPFGLDPKWRFAKNELQFTNSFKMKMSVIIGVLHMLLGIVLKGVNEIHLKNKIGFCLEFIPQLLFMSALFGYMIIIIFIKWGIDWRANTHMAPSILTQMMNIFLAFGSVNNQPLWGGGEKGHYTQESFHIFIFFVCLILIPLMLFVKPIMLYKRKNKVNFNDSGSDENKLVSGNANEIHSIIHEEDSTGHSFGEIFVHSAIETIEFVLGTISNTASYLRLWALSLAHGELSKVFFEKTLLDTISEGEYGSGFIKLLIGFFIFANVTLFVLLCMDLLECFLHTLRLHWVEFQSKFFKATGYKFTPFTFKSIIDELN